MGGSVRCFLMVLLFTCKINLFAFLIELLLDKIRVG